MSQGIGAGSLKEPQGSGGYTREDTMKPLALVGWEDQKKAVGVV